MLDALLSFLLFPGVVVGAAAVTVAARTAGSFATFPPEDSEVVLVDVLLLLLALVFAFDALFE